MAELGEVIGALLASVTHARRIADEETAAIAEYYKEHPLLEQLSVPRARVPKISLELPVLIESHQNGESSGAVSRDKLQESMRKALTESIAREGLSTRTAKFRSVREDFLSHLDRQLMRLGVDEGDSKLQEEAFARAVDDALAGAAERDFETDEPLLSREQSREVREDLAAASRRALRPGRDLRPFLTAEVVTSAVKEQADEQSVARLNIVIQEEGLEWTTTVSDNGGLVHRLGPE
ncbi:MAG: hypothetical protein AAGA90_09350 [Actinomycetota bacterium]